MEKSRVLLAILLLVLGLILCAFSAIVVFAVIQVVRNIGQAWVLPPFGDVVATRASAAPLIALGAALR